MWLLGTLKRRQDGREWDRCPRRRIPPNTAGTEMEESTSQEMWAPLKARGLPWWLGAKSPPAMQETQETWVRSLSGEDPLQKEMATHSSDRSRLKNPMDGGAWWATVQRVAKNWTRLSTRCWLKAGKMRKQFLPWSLQRGTQGDQCRTSDPQRCGVTELVGQATRFAVVCCRSNRKLHVDFIMLSVGHLENDGSLGYVQIFPMSTCFLPQSQTATVIHIRLNLSENSSSIRKLSSTKSSYPKFPLENSYFTIGNKCCQLLPLKWQTHFMRFWKMYSKYWSLTASLSLGGSCRKKTGLQLD